MSTGTRTVVVQSGDQIVVRDKLTPQDYGRRGALRRWGEPRILRLDALTPPQRRLVLALVDAVRKEAATSVEVVAAISTEGTADAASTR